MVKQKNVGLKEIVVKRFFQVTKEKINMYPSLFSRSLILEKPVEEIYFSKVRFLKFETFVDERYVKKMKLFWYMNMAEGEQNKEEDTILRLTEGKRLKMITLIFEEPAKAKDVLTLFFNFYGNNF